MQVCVGEQIDLGKHDFAAFPAATSQKYAEECFFNKKADNFRNYFIL